MIGIASYGAYVPILRLSQAAIAEAWGRSAAPGERTVANYDEDSITMAVEAAIDCLKGINREEIDALFFASTTPPYKEKQCAALIATVLDLDVSINTIDFIGSIRSGTIAVKAAIDAIKAGSAKQVLVVAADCRIGALQSDMEKGFGDGAAAVLIRDTEAKVSIESEYAFSDEFTFNWRKAADDFVRSWEDRFIITEGFLPAMMKAVTGVLNRSGLKIENVTRAALYAPNSRQHSALAKGLKLDPKSQLSGSSVLGSVGNTGAALALMMLVDVLEEAKPGDTLMMANYGDGADAYILKVHQTMDQPDRRGWKGYSASKIMLPNYHKYLQIKKLLKSSPESSPPGSLTAIWRERRSVYGCCGVLCRNCGTLQYPIQRVCCNCQAKDDFDIVNLSEKKGELVTFTKEMGQSADYPKVWAVAELEGGCRFFSVLVDVDADSLDAGAMGMPVEMTFRRLHEGSGFVNYIWKCRALRVAAKE